MRRREMLGFFGSGPLAMAAIEAAGAAEEPPQGVPAVALKDPQPRPTAVGVKEPRGDCFQSCEDVARSCMVVCDVMLMNELKARRGDAEALVKLHQALTDVRGICSLVASVALREGPFRATLCKACADVCDRCAEVVGATDLEQKDYFQRDDFIARLRDCAGRCRELAQLG